MSIEATNWTWSLDIKPASRKFVLMCLANHTNIKKGNTCWPSQMTIARLTGLSRTTVINCILELEEMQFIKILTKGNTFGKTNCYQLNMNANSKNEAKVVQPQDHPTPVIELPPVQPLDMPSTNSGHEVVQPLDIPSTTLGHRTITEPLPEPLRNRYSKNRKKPISEHWQPDDKIHKWALKNNISESFYLPLIDEFIIYWSERGDKRPGWSSTFINHVKRKLEQHNEKDKTYTGKYSAFDEATASAFDPD